MFGVTCSQHEQCGVMIDTHVIRTDRQTDEQPDNERNIPQHNSWLNVSNAFSYDLRDYRYLHVLLI